MSVIEVSPRCCFCLGEIDLFSLVESYSYEGKLEIYSDMIMECYGIDMKLKPEDVYKDLYVICKNCISYLRVASQFRDQVQNAHIRIQEFIHNYIPALIKFRQNTKISYTLAETVQRLSDDLATDVTHLNIKEESENRIQNNFYLQLGSDLTSYTDISAGDSQEYLVGYDSEPVEEDTKNDKQIGVHNGDVSLPLTDLDSEDVIIEADDLTCKICNETFSSLHSLKQHTSAHFGEYACKKCNKTFTTKITFYRHLRHHKDMKITRICKICNKTVKGNNYKRHMKAHDPKTNINKSIDDTLNLVGETSELNKSKITNLKSTTINQNVKKSKVIKIKIINQKKTAEIPQNLLNDKDLTCKICNEKFVWERTLKQHMAVHFPNYICHICSKPFVTSRNLSSHIRRHKDTNIVRTCDICKKDIRGRENFDRHVKTHSSEFRVYKCPLCPERFTYFRQKSIHLINVHNDKSKIYRCKLCEKGYSSNGRLSKHVQTVHLKIKNHVCDICNMAYFSKPELNRHLARHAAMKVFHCEICNKSFKRKKSLIEHIKMHDDAAKNFVCDICNEAFHMKGFLKAHMKVHNVFTMNLDGEQIIFKHE